MDSVIQKRKDMLKKLDALKVSFNILIKVNYRISFITQTLNISQKYANL